MRLFPQRSNPLCQRLSCDHPLKGGRREGHFDMGAGPCKTPGCNCPSFLYTEAVTLPRLAVPPSARHGAVMHLTPPVPPRREADGSVTISS